MEGSEEIVGDKVETSRGCVGDDKEVEAEGRSRGRSVRAEDGLVSLEGCEAGSRGIGDMRVVIREGCEEAGRDKGEGTCGWVEMAAGADGVDVEATS